VSRLILQNKEVERKMTGSPFQQRDLSPFLQVPVLVFHDLRIDIKAQVTHYVNKAFYDLSAYAFHQYSFNSPYIPELLFLIGNLLEK
jgi:hypothetical protein